MELEERGQETRQERVGKGIVDREYAKESCFFFLCATY